MKFLVSLASMLIVSIRADIKGPIVDTPLGPIEGFWQASRGGRQFQAYQGIPYALPPVGTLRFEPPQPVGAWEGVFPAKFAPPECLQYTQGTASTESTVVGSEDCLYLNVYTPVEGACKCNETKLLPVIVYIHGGAFQMGSGASFGPQYLLDKDVVFVTLNYRLGPLGFLSTEDAVVPGNMGLKDQTLAIKWVSDNIESFGGDPTMVTLTGVSAGAASVHLHYLSPMSRGLFHRGISLSGTALDCWTQTEASLEKVKKLGVLMGCPVSGNAELIRCLKSRPAKSILEFEAEFMSWLYNPFAPFGPVVEKDSAAPFIDKSPIEIITTGGAADLPWITSTVTEEGLYPASHFLLNEKLMKELDENWEVIAPNLLDYNYTIPRSQHAEVARRVRHHYLGNTSINLDNSENLIRMLGDRLFLADAGTAAQKQARANGSPVWFYLFGYRGEYSLSDIFTGTKENFGVAHSDDGIYVNSLKAAPLHDDEDIQMSFDLVNLWFSFAATGIPNMGIAWPSVDRWSQDLRCLVITKPGQTHIDNNVDFGRKNFWASIDFNENKL